MVFVGDYFAIGLVVVLCMFYFDGKTSRHYWTKADKFFVASLLLTAMTAATDLIAVRLMLAEDTPLALNIAANTFYFLINIITTSTFALFLFSKILEHAHDDHCMKKACTGLSVLFGIYLVVVISNLWNGCLFYFDESGVYHRGPLNVLGYVITIFQMCLVLICYARNRKACSQPLQGGRS